MDANRSTWQSRVEQALLAGDGDALRALYAEGIDLFGEDLGTTWAEALSAYDSSAVTG